MAHEHAEGRTEVAGLLRRLARDIDRGVVQVGASLVPCREDLVATVDAATGEPTGSVIITLQGSEQAHARHIALEGELAHPGG